MPKSRLGRGLSAIIDINTGESQFNISSNENIVKLSIKDIKANPDQPRKNFTESGIKELARSIKEHGLIQPVIVSKYEKGYILIAGERRLRAVISLKKDKIDAIIRDYKTERQLELALIENIQREDLNPIEIAEAYEIMIKRFQLTQEELSKKIGKKRTTITNTLRLLKLPKKVKDYVSRGTISMGHARALLSLDNNNIITMAEKIIKLGLSVRATEDMVNNVSRETKKHRNKILKKDPNLKKLEEDLLKRFGTKVDIQYKNKRGKIVIHFYSLDDLDRIINSLD